MNRLVITGTGTEIGKTIVTAAIAANALAAGQSVTVVKPAQTGLAEGDESDMDTVARLVPGAVTHELVRYRDPLAPASAARCAAVEPMTVTDMATAIEALPMSELLLVEGAGGLLVRFDATKATIADLAKILAAQVILVAAPGLGTLNQVALSAEAMRARDLDCRGVVIGAWPAEPDLASRENLADIPRYADLPLLGCLPSGVGTQSPEVFRRTAREALGPLLNGVWSGA